MNKKGIKKLVTFILLFYSQLRHKISFGPYSGTNYRYNKNTDQTFSNV